MIDKKTVNMIHAVETAISLGKVVYRRRIDATTEYKVAYIHEGNSLGDEWEYWPEWSKNRILPIDYGLDEYKDQANRTLGAYDEVIWILVAIMGEVGELINILKKVQKHKHKLQLHLVAEELGDILWYIAAAAKIFGLSLGEIAKQNIAKLKIRYPNGWSSEDSIKRKV